MSNRCCGIGELDQECFKCPIAGGYFGAISGNAEFIGKQNGRSIKTATTPRLCPASVPEIEAHGSPTDTNRFGYFPISCRELHDIIPWCQVSRIRDMVISWRLPYISHQDSRSSIEVKQQD